ncbi:neurosecretory protein VGF [Trachinotus anak]|uniref:neurosecretory protein VGF n=1 Tax=Trachinotus anak TaxID=443729 RepID=UPI0039F23CF0
MIRHHDASSVLTLLVLLTAASLLHPSRSSPINTPGAVSGPHRDPPSGLMVSEDWERRDEERRSLQKEEAEEELFQDVDPKTLAAVLLEALNRSQVERRKEGEEGVTEDEIEAERGGVEKEEEYRQVRTMEGAERDRDGRQKLELLMATQGREQEREEEEERKKAQEEEEKMTEKVTSRTTSQTVHIQTEQQLPSPDGRGESRKGASPQPTSSEQGSNEEEEQLTPEELKSLETMMKEFPRLDTKRKGESEQNQRESRGYSSHNDIIPINKGGNLAMSKKKLKWQEETQKALLLPTFRGGNFMDDFENSNYGGDVAEPPPPAQQEVMEEDEPEDEEEEKEDEEMLSPEEEEARAKAEQEEMRRQAAEAQRAKMEEEKLADIASDMLLRYMVKQNGNRKYSSSLSNAAEDKRSDEDQEVMEDDDIDPQTIDKLIEISSKLHLPADDVVDIISDVEKKKKKDVAPELMSRWQKPLTPLSSSFSSINGFSAPQVSTNQNNFPVSKQPSPPVSLHKPWFQEKTPVKPQDHWTKPNPLSVNQKLWPRPQRPPSIKQDLWLQPPRSVWTGYPSYPYIYPFYYQRKSYPDYYPIYFPPPPRPRPRYYIPKPALTLNNFLGNSVDDTFPPKRRYHSWVQPRLRKPPLQHRPYYTSLPLYPRTFQPVPVPKPRPAARRPAMSPQQRQMYFSATRGEGDDADDDAGKQSDSSRRDELQKYIQQILMKRPQTMD